MTRRPIPDAQFIAFLMELLSFIARWLNPEMSEEEIARFAGNVITYLTVGQPDESEQSNDDYDDLPDSDDQE